MKQKLYSNMHRMTTTFGVCILCVTLSLLALRLTVLGDMATEQPVGMITEGNLSEHQDGERLSYQINSKIYFAKPDSNGNVLIRNPESNEYHISVNIVMPDTDESLLFTGFIKPGESRNKAKLSQELDIGIYECVAEITAYDPHTLEPVGTLDQPVTLYIGEKAE